MDKYRETQIGLAEIIKIVCVYIFYICTLVISIGLYSAIDTDLTPIMWTVDLDGFTTVV
jgi:hypothetical protein